MVACLALACLAVPADEAALKAVVAKALKAANADRLKEVTAWTITEATCGPAKDGVTAYRREWVQLSDRYRLLHLVVQPDGATTTDLYVVNGDTGWSKRNGTVAEMGEREVGIRKQYIQTAGHRQVLALEDPDHELTLMPGLQIGGRPADAVRAVPKGGLLPTWTLAIDRETGRLIQVESRFPRTSGQPAGDTTTFSDVRPVGGFPLAHRQVSVPLSSGGFDRRTNTFTVAATLDPKLFEKPE